MINFDWYKLMFHNFLFQNHGSCYEIALASDYISFKNWEVKHHLNFPKFISPTLLCWQKKFQTWSRELMYHQEENDPALTLKSLQKKIKHIQSIRHLTTWKDPTATALTWHQSKKECPLTIVQKYTKVTYTVGMYSTNKTFLSFLSRK